MNRIPHQGDINLPYELDLYHIPVAAGLEGIQNVLNLALVLCIVQKVFASPDFKYLEYKNPQCRQDNGQHAAGRLQKSMHFLMAWTRFFLGWSMEESWHLLLSSPVTSSLQT